MNVIGLDDRVQLVSGIFTMTYAAAWSLLAALAVLAGVFSLFRAVLIGDAKDPVTWGCRLLVVVSCLTAYRWIFGSMMQASESLTMFFVENAGWDVYWREVAAQFRPLFEDGDNSAWDRLVGWMRGGVLTAVVSVSYYFEFMVFELIRILSACFASILYALGPLLIAGGVLADGKSLRQWFHSLVQVLLWPVVPPFLMLITVGASGNAISTDNVAFIIGQNLILAFLALLTPIIVGFVLGGSGVGALAGAVTTAGVSLVVGGVRAIAPSLERTLSPRSDYEMPAPQHAGAETSPGARRPGEETSEPERPVAYPTPAPALMFAHDSASRPASRPRERPADSVADGSSRG